MAKFIRPKPKIIASGAIKKALIWWLITIVVLIFGILMMYEFLFHSDPPQWFALILIIPFSISLLIVLDQSYSKTLNIIKYGSTPLHMNLCPATLGESLKGWFVLPVIDELKSVKVELMCKEYGKNIGIGGRDYWSTEKYFNVSRQGNQCFVNIEIPIPDNLPYSGFYRRETITNRNIQSTLIDSFHYKWKLRLHAYVMGIISLDRIYKIPVQQKLIEIKPKTLLWKFWPVCALVGKQLIPVAGLLFADWDALVILFVYWGETFVIYLMVMTMVIPLIVACVYEQWRQTDIGKILSSFKILVAGISVFSLLTLIYLVFGGYGGSYISAELLSNLENKPAELIFSFNPIVTANNIMKAIWDFNLVPAFICVMLVYVMDISELFKKKTKEELSVSNNTFFFGFAAPNTIEILIDRSIPLVVLLPFVILGSVIIVTIPSASIIPPVIIICLKALFDVVNYKRGYVK